MDPPFPPPSDQDPIGDSLYDYSILYGPILDMADSHSGLPSPTQYVEIEASYLGNLVVHRRAKALISQELYAKIKSSLLDPNNTKIGTAQFRYWARKMFQLVVVSGKPSLVHSGKPVAIKEEIYQILCRCHTAVVHGGRDRTNAEVRSSFSWIPKELVAQFVAACPTCSEKRFGPLNCLDDGRLPGDLIDRGSRQTKPYSKRGANGKGSNKRKPLQDIWLNADTSQSKLSIESPPGVSETNLPPAELAPSVNSDYTDTPAANCHSYLPPKLPAERTATAPRDLQLSAQTLIKFEDPDWSFDGSTLLDVDMLSNLSAVTDDDSLQYGDPTTPRSNNSQNHRTSFNSKAGGIHTNGEPFALDPALADCREESPESVLPSFKQFILMCNGASDTRAQQPAPRDFSGAGAGLPYHPVKFSDILRDNEAPSSLAISQDYTGLRAASLDNSKSDFLWGAGMSSPT